jgi:hypothetical protein
MKSRIGVLALLLCLFVAGAANAQSGLMAPGTQNIVGKWGSTLKGFDKDMQPPYYYEENVLLTISANGNIQLERTRRELKTRASETWIGNGVYTTPVPGYMKLTFSDNLGQDGAVWRYYISGDTMIIVEDSTGIQRKYYRIQTAIY